MIVGMNEDILLQYEWPYLATFLPSEEALASSARETGALRRKRGVGSASALLRLALAYGFCGLSLRQTAAWAQVAQVADVSDVALLKRLRKASGWLGQILAAKLAERAPPPQGGTRYRLRLVDATTVSKPGSKGTDWRIHLGFDLASMAVDHIELTDCSGGETLTRIPCASGDVVVGDRGYAHRRGLRSVVDAGADFIVRTNWQNLPLQTPAGAPFDLMDFLRRLPDATVGECDVQVAPTRRGPIAAFAARLVAVRKSEAAAEAARAKVLKERKRKGRSVDPRTLEAASYIFVLTSLPKEVVPPDQVLDLYRFRWQVELVFKRQKSLLLLDELPAKDPLLAQTFLYAKLLAALLVEDLTRQFLDFSPWGFRLGNAASVDLADPKDPP